MELENEAMSLDMKYNELLNIFIEKDSTSNK